MTVEVTGSVDPFKYHTPPPRRHYCGEHTDDPGEHNGRVIHRGEMVRLYGVEQSRVRYPDGTPAQVVRVTRAANAVTYFVRVADPATMLPVVPEGGGEPDTIQVYSDQLEPLDGE